ncbi:MAG: Flp pilus assembly protein CpaB [Bacillota bacterium]
MTVAVIVGLVVAVAAILYMRMATRTVPIAVAARDIDAHVRLEEEMIEVVYFPKDLASDVAIEDGDMIVGRFSRREIPRGTQILLSDLVDPGDTSAGVPWGLAERERAVAIPARPEAAVGGALRPGHLVDVIHFTEGSPHRGAGARTLLRRVRVEDIRDSAGSTWRPGDGNPPDTAVLAVAPREAEALCFAMATGSVYLISGPYPDDGGSDGSGVGAGNLYDYVGREAHLWSPPTEP